MGEESWPKQHGIMHIGLKGEKSEANEMLEGRILVPLRALIF